MKILEALNWATTCFAKSGQENPRLDSELLLADVLGLKRVDLYLNINQDLTPQQLSQFKKFVERRIAYEPIAYIIGKTEFMGREFKITPSVFIPRPETELLVEEILKLPLTTHQSPLTIIDLGTGCGVIACSLALVLDCKIYATDISLEALFVARENAIQLDVAKRIIFIQGDLFTPLHNLQVDIIVSNPPYVPTEDWEGLPKEVKAEPRIALSGGKEGLGFYRRIIEETPRYLKDNGYLALEIGINQSQKIGSMIISTNRFSNPKMIKDYAGIDRIIIAKTR
ncbi:MAG: peptide chain release factor N(5)-glutamine methyltransferase [bacterium]|nr:peptide chain release factor N(5)-glutamine methyltransferase [bacterium]